MKASSLVLIALAAAGCSSQPPAFPAGDVVDLSHTFDDKAVYWPTAERFWLQKVADGVTPAGYYYAANNFFSSEHGGTHLDAPVHFSEGGQAVDAIPIERFVGVAAVVDVTDAASRNVDYQVSLADIENSEREDGPIPSQAIVLIRTGFSHRWGDAARYLGTAERGDAATRQLHFPGLHPEAARWLMTNRDIKAVGIDTASIDYGRSTMFETHRALFARNVPAFENLASLERLPARGAVVMALPMKIGGGSGAPLRAVAILPR